MPFACMDFTSAEWVSFGWNLPIGFKLKGHFWLKVESKAVVQRIALYWSKSNVEFIIGGDFEHTIYLEVETKFGKHLDLIIELVNGFSYLMFGFVKILLM